MGVQVRITVYAADQKTGDAACRAAFARIGELEDITSDYRPRSELMRLCARAGGPSVEVSEDLYRVVERAHDLAERSGGAFDATVGAYTHLWRRSQAGENEIPPSEWDEAQALVNWRNVRLDADARTVELAVPDMQLDLGGIAKGYALDAALEVLREQGCPRALVSAGGDIAVGDPPPSREGWRVRVWDADEEHRWLTVENCGVSSSGDTEQLVEIDGELFSHIIDPRSGLRYGEPLLATVIAPDATTSDGVATACVVLGEEKAKDLVDMMPDVTAYIRRATPSEGEQTSPREVG